jgi:hypothetical protein
MLVKVHSLVPTTGLAVSRTPQKLVPGAGCWYGAGRVWRRLSGQRRPHDGNSVAAGWIWDMGSSVCTVCQAMPLSNMERVTSTSWRPAPQSKLALCRIGVAQDPINCGFSHYSLHPTHPLSIPCQILPRSTFSSLLLCNREAPLSRSNPFLPTKGRVRRFRHCYNSHDHRPRIRVCHLISSFL